jgi:glycosyltransferase involved in cell wall biosynthesis
MPLVCFTFVGDPRIDSRLRRCVRTLADANDVVIVTLSGETDRYEFEGARVIQYGNEAKEPLRKRLPRFWREGRNTLLDLGADMFISSDLYTMPLAAYAARTLGRPLVYDSRELYRAIGALANRPVMQAWWRMIEWRHVRHASAIMTVNESLAGMLRAGYPHVPVVVVPNYPDWPAVEKTDLLRRRHSIDPAQPVLLSQGGLQAGRGAMTALEVLKLLDRGHLVYLGSGHLAEVVPVRAAELGIAGRVHVQNAVPSAELSSWTASADIGLCLMEDLGVSYYHSLPNKLFEYIAAGLPVIGSNLPEITRVLDEGAGIAVDVSDVEGIASVVHKLLGDAQLFESFRARNHVLREKYCWNAVKERLIEIVDENIKTRKG